MSLVTSNPFYINYTALYETGKVSLGDCCNYFSGYLSKIKKDLKKIDLEQKKIQKKLTKTTNEAMTARVFQHTPKSQEQEQAEKKLNNKNQKLEAKLKNAYLGVHITHEICNFMADAKNAMIRNKEEGCLEKIIKLLKGFFGIKTSLQKADDINKECNNLLIQDKFKLFCTEENLTTAKLKAGRLIASYCAGRGIGFPQTDNAKDWSKCENLSRSLDKALEYAQEQMKKERKGRSFRYIDPPEEDVWQDIDWEKGIQNIQRTVEEGEVGGLPVGICYTQGRRPTMEDEQIRVAFPLHISGKDYPVQLFGIFDGHGGEGSFSEASRYVCEHLQEKLKANLEKFNSSGFTDQGIYYALKATFIELNKDYVNSEGFYENDGTTATVAMVLDDKLWTANVGDSRIVLNNNGKPVQLTEDAKLDIPRHQERIIECGGKIILWDNELRHVGKGAGITMATVIGHPGTKGASPEPEITMTPLSEIEEGSDLILCCDGIYEVASTKQVVELNHNPKKSAGEKALNELNHNPKRPAGEKAFNIAYAAFGAVSKDNLSCMVITPLGRKKPVTPVPDEKQLESQLKEQRQRAKDQMKRELDNESFHYVPFTPNMSASRTSGNLRTIIKWDATIREGQAQPPSEKVGIAYMQGRADTIEDEHIAVSFNLRIGDTDYPIQLYGIFDGHLDNGASSYVRRHLQKKLEIKLQKSNPSGLTDKGISDALRETFEELNTDFTVHKESKEYTLSKHAGTTATVAMILNGNLWTANLGASRIVLDINGEPVQLTEDDECTEEGQGISNGISSTPKVTV